MPDRISLFEEALLSLDKVRANELFHEALTVYDTPLQVVEGLVVPALEHIGKKWDVGDVALSQVYMSSRFCEELVDLSLPPSDPDRKHQPRSAIVILSDFHMLGKRIVYSVMRASGFELFDYGRMSVEELIERAVDDRIRVLLISVLMLPSALKIRDVRDAFDSAGIDIKIAVGGAPFLFDEQLWSDVGADAMGRNASDAVEIVDGWMREMS